MAEAIQGDQPKKAGTCSQPSELAGQGSLNGSEIQLISEDFDLVKTFECGQAFRWRRVPGLEASGSTVVYEGIALGHFLRLRQNAESVFLETSQETFEACWKDYFDWSTDYGKAQRQLLKQDPHPVMAEAAALGKGIRLLRQDPWETLMTFILSGNNNIPRIKGSIEALSERFGEAVAVDRPEALRGQTENWKAFPTPEALARASLQDYRQAGAGYRDQFLLSVAQKVAGGEVDLEAWQCLEDGQLRQALMTLPGVGEKVAACVMLFGYGRKAAFPVDTWIRKAMRQLYFDHEASAREIEALAKARFGDQAGYAQQLLFYWSRFSKNGGERT